MKYTNYSDFSVYHIKLFLSLAETLNYTKVADECFVTQSTLSRVIIQLENMLGIQLFVRNTTKVALTPAGRSLYKDMMSLDSSIEQAIQKAHQIQTGKNRLLNIGVTDGMNISAELLPFLKAFQEKHANFEITFIRELENNLTKKLLEHAYDIVFDFAVGEVDKRSINEEPVFSGPNVIYMLESNPLCRKETVTIADLENQILLVRAPSLRPEGLDYIMKLFRDFDIKPNFAPYVPNALDMSINLKEANQAIFADRYYIDRYCPFLVSRPIENTRSTVWVRWLKEFSENKNTDIFVQDMLDYFAPEPVGV